MITVKLKKKNLSLVTTLACMAAIESDESPFTVYSESDGVFFRIFTPEEPVHRRNGENTMWDEGFRMRLWFDFRGKTL